MVSSLRWLRAQPSADQRFSDTTGNSFSGMQEVPLIQSGNFYPPSSLSCSSDSWMIAKPPLR